MQRKEQGISTYRLRLCGTTSGARQIKNRKRKRKTNQKKKQEDLDDRLLAGKEPGPLEISRPGPWKANLGLQRLMR
jgi:hypothetical protein